MNEADKRNPWADEGIRVVRTVWGWFLAGIGLTCGYLATMAITRAL